ncbi:MAG: energy-coupling factor ABC transporter permease, partial [Smithella sp.]
MIKSIFVALICCGVLLAADAAYAMHIAEGILPFHWAAFWFVIAIPFVAYGLYSLNKRSRDDL